jgi:hypothetical protein
MPSFRDIKGRPIEEALTSRDDVTLDGGDDEVVSGAVGRAIVVADNPHRDEIAAAREKALKERGPKPPRAQAEPPSVMSVWPEPPDLPRVALPLPEDFEAGLVALETNLRQALDLCAALRARAQMDHDKLAKVDSLIAALKG